MKMYKKYEDCFICILYKLSVLKIKYKKMSVELNHYKKINSEYKEKDKKQRKLIFKMKNL